MNKLIFTAIALIALIMPTHTPAMDARKELVWCDAKIQKALKSLAELRQV